MRVMLIAAVFALGVVPAIAQPAAPVVVADGEAIVKRAPDRAWLSMAVESRDVRSTEARRKNAEAMKTVHDVLRGAGVPQNAIRTTGFSVSPEMEWKDGRGTLRGYVVRNQIEVRVDNLDRLPDLLDAVNSPRGVALSVEGPRFDLKDEASVAQEALRLAVEMAMSRAQAMAAGAKRQLGQVLRIEEPTANVGLPQPMFAMRAAAPAEPQTPIIPGELDVRARVTITVELK